MLNIDAFVGILKGKPWAVFDVHLYFTWGGADGAGIPAANCSTDVELKDYVTASDVITAAQQRSIINLLENTEWGCTVSVVSSR